MSYTLYNYYSKILLTEARSQESCTSENNKKQDIVRCNKPPHLPLPTPVSIPHKTNNNSLEENVLENFGECEANKEFPHV